MRSPRVSAAVMLSKTAFTITSASRREKRGNIFSTSSIRSRFVMLSSLREGTPVQEEEAAAGPRGSAEEAPAVEELEQPRQTTRAHPTDARLARLVRGLPREAGGR